MNHLVIIEAPGKRATFLEALRETGRPDWKVEATGGRLFDLPETTLGINPDWSADWRPVNPARLEAIQAALTKAGTIWIATDNDIEGELIAFHVKRLAPNDTPMHRIRVLDITAPSIDAAINMPTGFDRSLVASAMARRLFDRLVGYALSDFSPGEHGAPYGIVGRILTPLLRRCTETRACNATLQVPVPGHNALIDIPVFVASNQEAAFLASLGAGLPAPALEAFESPDLLTGGEAAFALAQLHGKPVKEVTMRLQGLYEAGAISYWRTDNSFAHPTRIAELSRHAVKEGMRAFESFRLAQQTMAAPELGIAHGALLPATRKLPPACHAEKAHFDWIVGRSLAAGLPAEHHLNGSLRLIDAYWTRGLAKAMPGTPVVHAGLRAAPSGQAVLGSAGGVMVRRLPADAMLLRLMLDMSLARPSTYLHHADRIARRYLQSDNRPNRVAYRALDRAHQVAPLLADPAAIAKVDHILCHSPERHHVPRIEASLRVLNLTADDLFRMAAEKEATVDKTAAISLHQALDSEHNMS